MRLAGKKVIVTGANRSIGKANQRKYHQHLFHFWQSPNYESCRTCVW